MGSISRTCKAAEFHTMSAAKCKVKRLVNNYARCPDAGEGEEQTLMALVTTEKMLKDAQAGHYAVGAFNVENLEFVMAVLAAAEETKSPVIMQTTPGTIKTAGLDYFYGMVKAAAERASVPVALHLDHGDGYDRCMQAFRTGYTSVMIDGSHESFEDNIALTKSVADAGRAMGVPVEAELGKVGGKEDDGPAVEARAPTPILPRPRSSSSALAAPRWLSALVPATACTRAIRTSSSPWSRPSAMPSTCRWSCTAPPVCPMSRLPRL